MKKSLLAIAFAAATLTSTFAQTPAPTQPAPDQKSTATTKKTTKSSKHHSKKTTDSKSTTSTPPQK